MDANLTSEERAQILQTIEMFEVIAQTQPDDCQSLDILKEAYIKIGQQDDALRVGRRLAESYLQNGLYSSALLECEQILSKQPTSPDVVALMGEIESRSGGSSSSPNAASNGKETNGKDATERGAESGLTAPRKAAPQESGLTAPREASSESTGLTAPARGGSEAGLTAPGKITTNSTSLTKTRRVPGAPSLPSISLPEEDGSEQYARYLVHHRIVSDKVAVAALTQMRAINKKIIPGSQPAAALLEQISKAGGPPVDEILGGLIDATKLGYLSLENYDIDRSVVRMLPETLTMGRLIVPFDIVSRTLMVAFCNPFDSAAKEATHSSLDYHIQWYLAKPAAIMRVLKDVYRLDARD
jgi:Type II secretion system (T2SS), protein E, N-terminal domain